MTNMQKFQKIQIFQKSIKINKNHQKSIKINKKHKKGMTKEFKYIKNYQNQQKSI